MNAIKVFNSGVQYLDGRRENPWTDDALTMLRKSMEPSPHAAGAISILQRAATMFETCDTVTMTLTVAEYKTLLNALTHSSSVSST